MINIDNPNVFADDTFEGYEYIIKDVSNLVIEAPEGISASVVTQAPYANVLSFKGCSGIVLKNITAGHKVEKGYCTGGVIMLDGCRGASSSPYSCVFYDAQKALRNENGGQRGQCRKLYEAKQYES